jgi:hypothetical protein
MRMNSRATARRIHDLQKRFLQSELGRGYRAVTSKPLSPSACTQSDTIRQLRECLVAMIRVGGPKVEVNASTKRRTFLRSSPAILSRWAERATYHVVAA